VKTSEASGKAIRIVLRSAPSGEPLNKESSRNSQDASALSLQKVLFQSDFRKPMKVRLGTEKVDQAFEYVNLNPAVHDVMSISLDSILREKPLRCAS
jgi:hypothetical protein